jgi:hypothetical protein
MIDLFCYIVINGHTIDLSSLCQQSPIPAVVPATEPAETNTVEIEKFVLSDNGQFSGRIRNISDGTILFPKLHYEAYDASGNFLESGSFHADMQSLEPDGTSGFDWFTNRDAARVRITNISWERY